MKEQSDQLMSNDISACCWLLCHTTDEAETPTSRPSSSAGAARFTLTNQAGKLAGVMGYQQMRLRKHQRQQWHCRGERWLWRQSSQLRVLSFPPVEKWLKAILDFNSWVIMIWRITVNKFTLWVNSAPPISFSYLNHSSVISDFTGGHMDQSIM